MSDRAISSRRLKIVRDGDDWRIIPDSDEPGAKIRAGLHEVDELVTPAIDVQVDNYTSIHLKDELVIEDTDLIAFEVDDEVMIIADNQSH